MLKLRYSMIFQSLLVTNLITFMLRTRGVAIHNMHYEIRRCSNAKLTIKCLMTNKWLAIDGWAVEGSSWKIVPEISSLLCSSASSPTPFPFLDLDFYLQVSHFFFFFYKTPPPFLSLLF